jgi:hypothetical protein
MIKKDTINPTIYSNPITPPGYRRSHPWTYAHAIMKKTTVITTNITSAIRLLLKTDSCAKIASQAQCQPFDCEIISFQRNTTAWLVAGCKNHASNRCKLQGRDSPKYSLPVPRKNSQGIRLSSKCAQPISRLSRLNEMKLLMLAHVVLHSDFCMGHDSIASKYRPVSKSRYCHRGRVYTGLTVTRISSADVAVCRCTHGLPASVHNTK